MRIIYQNEEGGVSIVIPSGELPIEEVLAKDVPFGVAAKIVPESEIPSDRTFRNAWSADLNSNKPIFVRMPEARNVWRDKIRAERKPLLEAADVEFMLALEQGDEAKRAQVIAKKQALRDATQDPRIEAAQTPEALKAVDALANFRS